MTDAPAPTLEDARAVLAATFGHKDFRGLQGAVIGEVLAGRNALAVLPTGGGKSLCYQIPSLLRRGLGIVVSPLIALMTDQVAALRQLGVAAARLDSAIEPAERRYRTVAQGQSPERMVRIAVSAQEIGLVALIKQAGLAASHSEARRLIEGGGIRVDGQTITDVEHVVRGGAVLSRGKNRFVQVDFL